MRVKYSFLMLLLTFLIIQPTVHSQVVNESAKKKFSIGFGMFNDFLLNVPAGLKTRTINQGVDLFALYNIPFGKSNFGFSIGLGLTVHNIYGNFITKKSGDTTDLVKIPDTVSFKRSKMTIVYLDIPLEFTLKTKSKVVVAIGAKIGYNIGSHTKYVGDGQIEIKDYTTDKVKVKSQGIKNLQQFSVTPTIRIGYKWISLQGQYMVTTLFQKDHGPDMYPISAGIVLVPF
jgi:hypothetical protein